MYKCMYLTDTYMVFYYVAGILLELIKINKPISVSIMYLLKTTNICYPTVSVGQDLGRSLARWSGSGSLYEDQTLGQSCHHLGPEGPLPSSFMWYCRPLFPS